MEPTKPSNSSSPTSRPVSHTPMSGGTGNTTPIQHTAQTTKPQQSSHSGLSIKGNGGWFGQIKGALSLVAFVAGVLLAAFLINQFVFQSYFVEGTSMVPTLQNNDRLIIEKVGKTWDQLTGQPYIPNRGDIVVLDSSIVTANGSIEQLIKRVIGLPGETVRVDNGTVTVYNSQEPGGFNVDERLGLHLEQTYSPSPQEFKVPEGKVFVMGDNRTQNGSHDSRAFGAVASKDLEGRLWARILPVNQAKVF